MPQNNPLSQNGQNRGFPWHTLLKYILIQDISIQLQNYTDNNFKQL